MAAIRNGLLRNFTRKSLFRGWSACRESWAGGPLVGRMSTIRAQRYKKIIENRPFFTKKLSIIFLKKKDKGRRPGKVTSYIRHHPSDIIHLFRTSPVPFNLEGAPPLSCILPPQEEENRSACRSYIKVSADHQRSGFFCALRQGRRSKAGQGSMRLCRGSRFSDLKVQSDLRSMTKLKATSYFLHQTSSFRHLMTGDSFVS